MYEGRHLNFFLEEKRKMSGFQIKDIAIVEWSQKVCAIHLILVKFHIDNIGLIVKLTVKETIDIIYLRI